MIKEGHEQLKLATLELFNDILEPNAQIPITWKRTRLTMIFKDGQPELPENYRPISILVIFYKLFSRCLCARLTPTLDEEQTVDQAGFRAGFRTIDHLSTMVQIQEKCYEWNLPLFISTVDFKKAFDSVSHCKLWQAMLEKGVPTCYVDFLSTLYGNQTGYVRTDRNSREFGITRGVKQGDPLSPLLFNCILEYDFRKHKEKWEYAKFGLQMTSDFKLSNLRFAHDVLLVSSDLDSLLKMLKDLADHAREVGLELHPKKTKKITNLQKRRGANAEKYMLVGLMQIEILPSIASQSTWGGWLVFTTAMALKIKTVSTLLGTILCK